MATKTEKMLLLLKYLKRFTDERNPTSMPLIDYYFEKKKGKKLALTSKRLTNIRFLCHCLSYGRALPCCHYHLLPHHALR